MFKRHSVRLALGLALAALPTLAQAHFILLEPTSTLVQNQLGDPQKLGPCGGTTANAGTPTQIVSRVKGGTPLHITIRETIYHPGHYRVALVVNATRNCRPIRPRPPATRHADRSRSARRSRARSPRRSSPTACSRTRRGQRISFRPTCRFPTSPARSARCRSRSSWRNTV